MSAHDPFRRAAVILAAFLVALGGLASTATAKSAKVTPDPPLTVDKAHLAAGLHCPVPVVKGGKQPILLVTGTGFTGAEAYAIGQAALTTLKQPLCYVDFPYRTTGDIQISVQYLVYGIRTVERQAGRPIAMFGVSQGGLLPRWALTYWPSLRKKVTDVIAVAGTQHGTNLIGTCSLTEPCTPAVWQQRTGSNLLNAINRQKDESPDPTSWTTVRSATDETVQPQQGRHPTSALKGATNILIQDVCPGRSPTHIGSALDSVTFAATLDAFRHKGPAKVSRLPKDVCSSLYAPGITGGAGRRALRAFVPDPQTEAPKVTHEPKVKAYARRLVSVR